MTHHRPPSAALLASLAGLAIVPSVRAQPVSSAWPAGSAGPTVVAAAPLAGVYATASTATDAIEIRDVRGAVLRQVTREQLQQACPWMSLDAGPDGPAAMTLSDSGRLLFVAVNEAPNGQGQSGAVVRVDISGGQVSALAPVSFNTLPGAAPTGIALAHYRASLYVGSPGPSGPRVVAYPADRNATASAPGTVYVLPGGSTGGVRALAVDRDAPALLAASETAVSRSSLASAALSWSTLGPLAGVTGMAWSGHYGGAGQAGLYLAVDAGAGGTGAAELRFASPLQLSGTLAFNPSAYTTLASAGAANLSATADGGLLVGAADGARLVRDASDTRLGFDAFLADEFAQVVAFHRGLATKPGVPVGWVRDTEVASGTTGFPVTPDAAGWTLMLLVADDAINATPGSRTLARDILVRYGGLAADGIAPSRTADGIYRHWMDPANGQTLAGWDPEFATLSTMLLMMGAARARDRWWFDADVQRAASRIICGVRNHDAYVEATTPWASYFKGLSAGGPDLSSRVTAFNETIVWVEQLAAFGGTRAQTAYGRWLERSRWPTNQYVAGRILTGDSTNYLPAFVSLYPLIATPAYRASADWGRQIQNLRDSSAAWTDDNAPRYFTVFSAGTSNPAWGSGGYHPDNLGVFPGRVATFPSLMAFASGPGVGGRTPEAVAAYHAYRRGARQAFPSGASILYRRSDQTPAWTPNSAGVPDVALGALGLAELLKPGLTDALLARPYGRCPCWSNCDASTSAPALNALDFSCFLQRYQAGDVYANCDSSTAPPALNALDFSCFLQRYGQGCN